MRVRSRVHPVQTVIPKMVKRGWMSVSHMIDHHHLPSFQWPFQDPKLEVPTIYKAYFLALNFRGYPPKKGQKYGTLWYVNVPPFKDPGDLPLIICPWGPWNMGDQQWYLWIHILWQELDEIPEIERLPIIQSSWNQKGDLGDPLWLQKPSHKYYIYIYMYAVYIYIHMYVSYSYLVGGFNPSEKYELVSWDDDIPNI